MVEITHSGLTISSADMIIIPQSTAGTVSDSFKKLLAQLKVTSPLATADLGDIFIIPVTASGPKYICLACSVNDFTSTYITLYRIVKNLAIQLPEDVKTISLPLLGTGAGSLTPYKVYFLLVRALSELLPGKEVTLHLLDKSIQSAISHNNEENVGKPAKRLVFDYTVDEVKAISWVEQQMQMKEFYFQFAKDKFNEFLEHKDEIGFYTNILQSFKESGKVFSQFLYTYDAGSNEFRFLELCGKLVAYIDHNAYNKNLWNLYDDKRTLARSSVNQTRWIDNLLNFKVSEHNYQVLTDSIKNALFYLDDPGHKLTMLSLRHRALAAKELHFGTPVKEFASVLASYFSSKGIECENPLNNGSLYSRILYIPDIKELWNVDTPLSVEGLNTTRVATSEASQEGTLTEMPDEDVVPEEIRHRNVNMLMHSDIYAKDDLLHYDTYASIIARLITSNLSTPPFNISIMAPWGKGKTSLMRFIEKRINPNLANKQKDDKGYSSWSLFAWSLIKRESSDSLKAVRFKLLPASFVNPKSSSRLDNPVIWFNAWKFQKSEQVWAGLADEIIRQLASQLDPVERQKFWFKLNLKRVNRSKITYELTLTFFRKVLLPLTYLSCGFLIQSLFKSLSDENVFPKFITDNIGLLGTFPVILAAIAAVQKLNLEWSKVPDIDWAKFISRPEYRSKTGYLQEVEDDLKHSIKLAVNPKRPAVIFIDDLDRCSPNVIADVIEAINAFMTGELSNCYFIVGQDPRLVTASLDAAYEKISIKLGKLESEHGTIGRFFMEKFTQLTINLPVMSPTVKRSFVDALFSKLDEGAIPGVADKEQLLRDYKALQDDILTRDDPKDIFTEAKENLESKIRTFNQELVLNFQDAILSNAFRSFQVDDNELENIILDIGEYLDSPRTIKRFLNLFLFYHFFRFTIPGKGLLEVEDDDLSRWLLIMVRWPSLVQAIQWDTEKGFFKGGDCMERAANFDQFIAGSENYAHYTLLVKEENINGLTWQCDEELYSLCKGNTEQPPVKIVTIIKSGIW